MPRLRERALRGGGGTRAMLVQYRLQFGKFWLTNVLVGVGTPFMYLGALGLGLGLIVDSGPGGTALGIPYIAFLAPGLLAATAMQLASTDATFPVLNGFVWDRMYFGAHATPITPTQILRGVLSAIGLKVLGSSTAFLAVAAVFGSFHTPWALLTPLIATGAALAFAAPITAIVANSRDEGGAFNYIFRFVVTPMMLFGGTFYDIDRLPEWAQWIAWLMPMWHSTELCRGAALGPLHLASGVGHLSFPMVVVHVGYLLVWLAGGYALSAWRFRVRLSS